jgi:leader peptidase (prepilin peptidase)/N-methyltransferase
VSRTLAKSGTLARPVSSLLRRLTASHQQGLGSPWQAATRSLPLIAAAALVALWSLAAASGWLVLATAAYGWTLLALAVTDARRFLLPDVFTIPLMLAGFAVAAAIDPDRLPEHLIGAAAGFAVFFLFSQTYRRLRGRDGLGHGDAKLMAALGAWLGWQGLPSVVLIAALGALLVVFAQRLLGQAIRMDRRLPFGAYLAVGAWLVWLYGPLTSAFQG